MPGPAQLVPVKRARVRPGSRGYLKEMITLYCFGKVHPKVIGYTRDLRIQQFRIRGRIADAHVVHRIDHAHAEEVRPSDVRQVAGGAR